MDLNTVKRNHTEAKEAFERLLIIMDELRAFCPWDKKQTFESLRILSLEEVYELSDAILEKDEKGIKEELGDLMLHLVFYAKLGSENQSFEVADILHQVCDKLVSRHPHIYSDVKVQDEFEVKKNWEQIKLTEGKKSTLSGVPKGLPAMIKAYRMQDKTAQVGFQWDDISDVWAKVEEEIQELQTAIVNEEKDKVEEEFGDVLFSMINYARYLGIDPESALEKVNKKFQLRFEHIEKRAIKPLHNMTLGEMDELWNEAKTIHKQKL